MVPPFTCCHLLSTFLPPEPLREVPRATKGSPGKFKAWPWLLRGRPRETSQPYKSSELFGTDYRDSQRSQHASQRRPSPDSLSPLPHQAFLFPNPWTPDPPKNPALSLKLALVAGREGSAPHDRHKDTYFGRSPEPRFQDGVQCKKGKEKTMAPRGTYQHDCAP